MSEENWDEDISGGGGGSSGANASTTGFGSNTNPQSFDTNNNFVDSNKSNKYGFGSSGGGGNENGFSGGSGGGNRNSFGGSRGGSFSGNRGFRNNNNEDGQERKPFVRRFDNNGENREYRPRRNYDNGGESGSGGGGFNFKRRDNSQSKEGDNNGSSKSGGWNFGNRNEDKKNDESGSGGFGFNGSSGNSFNRNREGGNGSGRGRGSGRFNSRERRFNNSNNNEEGGSFKFRGNDRRENNGSNFKSNFGENSSSGNNDEQAEKRGYGFGGGSSGSRGFGSKDKDNNKEESSSGGWGGSSSENRKEGFSTRGNFERRGGGAGNFRDRGDRERRGFREDNDQKGERKPREGGDNEDAAKRERYIPPEQEESEEALFTTITAGINFKKQNEIPVNLTGTNSEQFKPIESFEEAKLTELLQENVRKSKYEIPTPVQKYAIPIISARRDLMACAQTGSGKTAAFVLPIMTNILNDGLQSSALVAVQQPQALILSPTRELAIQIFHECRKFSHGSIIRSAILYGGVDTGYQISGLRDGCNILVATPGRLLDILQRGVISLEKVKYFVLDEADRMLDLGFEQAIREILNKGQVMSKGDRCTLMFSATFPAEIQQLAQDYLHDYLFLTVGTVGGANSDVQQEVHKVAKFDKREKVFEILNEIGNEKIMIFIEQKKQADVLGFYLLQKGYPSTTIHGDRLQSQRETALNEFKSGKSKIIVATSVAARGLDIENVNYVLNYDLPSSIDEYVHRIGRTGRCGNLGKSISFFDPDLDNDRRLARSLVRILEQAQQNVPQWLRDIAEDALGTAYTGNECKDDLRGQFNSMSFSANANVAGGLASQSKPIAQLQEENWD
jgi:probable ATP-dependent RNA helicase DDX4